jgi:hypothetical protein
MSQKLPTLQIIIDGRVRFSTEDPKLALPQAAASILHALDGMQKPRKDRGTQRVKKEAGAQSSNGGTPPLPLHA